jgi:hypothetical protein
MINKFFSVKGWVRQDPFGRIVIDDCPSDETHLRHSKTNPETNKPSCRYLLEQFFDRGEDTIIGKRGHLTVTFSFAEDTDCCSLEEAVRRYCEEAAK